MIDQSINQVRCVQFPENYYSQGNVSNNFRTGRILN